MSDSGLSSAAIPAEAEIEECLRRVVRQSLKNDEEITINKARERAEKELGLDEGYFKGDANWKTRSKVIINDTAAEEPVSSPEKPAKPILKKAAPKPKAKPAAKAGRKRKSDDAPPAKTKRRKKVESEEELSESFDDDEEEEENGVESKEDSGNDSDSFAEDVTPVKTNKRKAPVKKSKVESESEEEAKPKAKPKAKAATTKAGSKKSQNTVVSDSDDEEEDTKAGSKPTRDPSELSDPPASLSDNEPKAEHNVASDNESEMSVLIDDPPPKKKRNPKAAASESKAKATKSTAAASKKKGEPLSKNEEEIRRLQGWLVKCGIRKLWHRELANCDTEKAKIQHLKKMLDAAGMDGRPSNEKAKQIKEARELQEEIEAAKEFEKRWGQGNEEDGSGSEEADDDDVKDEGEEDDGKADAKPKRVLPKGFVDFGDSGDDSG
jgi:hypothetical protein